MRVPVLVHARAPRVNLMPHAEIERRRRAALVRTWAWVIVAALAAVAVTAGAAFIVKLAADQRLRTGQARTTELLTELAALSPVSTALVATRELGTFRSEAMGADVVWGDTVAGLAATLPAGVRITGFDVVVGSVPVTGAEPASAATAEPGLVGTLTLGSGTPLDMAGTIRALRSAPGVLSVDGRDITQAGTEGAAYTYLLDVELDQSIYGGAYAAEETG